MASSHLYASTSSWNFAEPVGMQRSPATSRPSTSFGMSSPSLGSTATSTTREPLHSMPAVRASSSAVT
eukprot:3872764-Lingulodinium_polyedra.AAC.1